MCTGATVRVIELTPTPLANSFPKEPDVGEVYPLDLMECVRCGHVQLLEVVPRETLFTDYKYRTPKAFSPHLQGLAYKLRERYPHKRKLLEIGCNNGLFLDEAKKEGFEVVGVDPAMDIMRYPGSFRRFFGEDTPVDKVDIVVALNAFAHIDDLDSVFKGINRCLNPDGVVVFEVQSLAALVENGMFDMIYHEHLDYHTVFPWAGFLGKFGLFLNDVELISTHGGSLRITASRIGPGMSVIKEDVDWNAFKYKIEQARNKVIFSVRASKKDLVCFGATAKATTLIHHFGLQDKIKYCFDETPEKQNRYLPGTSIKIVNRFEGDPLVLLTAWNYEGVFKERFPDLSYINPYRFDWSYDCLGYRPPAD